MPRKVRNQTKTLPCSKNLGKTKSLMTANASQKRVTDADCKEMEAFAVSTVAALHMGGATQDFPQTARMNSATTTTKCVRRRMQNTAIIASMQTKVICPKMVGMESLHWKSARHYATPQLDVQALSFTEKDGVVALATSITLQSPRAQMVFSGGMRYVS